ncbi:hypothetical protein ACFVSW_27430 [Neobacillus sp. NPDC058068]|uniref:hypothetical protein n=1 Tax=Neobacillus sp. NPDC058068 TaxID=3346325 RepID=UPI0036DC10DD
MKIKTKEIEQLVLMLLNKLKEKDISEVTIDTDYYWSVDWNDIENFKSESLEFGVGSFCDDWNHLQKILSGEFELNVLDLQRLSTLLNILGKTIHESEVSL